MADVYRSGVSRASSILHFLAAPLLAACGSAATPPSSPPASPMAATSMPGSMAASMPGSTAASIPGSMPGSMPEVLPEPTAAPGPVPAADGRQRRGELLGDQARRLRFAVASTDGASGAEEIARGVRGALARVGYWLVEPPEEADAFLEVAVNDAGADRTAERSVSIRLARDGAVLEWLVAPLPEGDHDGPIQDLVDRLTASRGLAEVVDLVRPSRTLVEAAVARGPGAAGPTAPAPVGFSAAAARRCRNQRSGDACEQIAQHLAAFPHGEHASAAREVLRRAGYPEPAAEARGPESPR